MRKASGWPDSDEHDQLGCEPAMGEMSKRQLNGPSRHFATTQQLGRFRSEADIARFSV
jgi:hypothetical protein